MVSLDFIFQACQGLALIGWGALVLAPLKRDYCIGLARGIALVLGLAYLAQFLFTTVPAEGGSFTTLAGVTALFAAPANVMLGWTHFLAFDLFVGSWEAEDAGRRGVPHWLVIPCLAATLMVGPVGLLLWFILRTLHGRFAK